MVKKAKKSSVPSLDMNKIGSLMGIKIQKSADWKYSMNVGGCMDLPFGSYVKTASGRWVFNGGIGATTGFIAKANSFKSYIINKFILTAAVRTYMTTGATRCFLYDTESTVNRATIVNSLRTIARENNVDEEEIVGLLDNDNIILTDSSCYSGNKYITMLEDFLEQKLKVNVTCRTALLNSDGTPFEIPWPTFSTIDSLTDWKSDAVVQKENDTEIGESKANTLFMQGGLHKTRLLGMINELCIRGGMYMGLTAQLGKKSGIADSPMSRPTRDMPALMADEKISGVSAKFAYTTSNSIKGGNATPLDIISSGNKRSSRYPFNSSSVGKDTKDLFVVPTIVLRSKTGKSSIGEHLVLSQTRGWLGTMTEFYRLDVVTRAGSVRTGIIGNDRNYSMLIYPDVKLSRTNIFRKTEADPRLRRAINITSELSQFNDYHKDQPYWDYYMPIEELHQKLIDLGYDWMKILDTRGWYGLNEKIGTDEEPVSLMTLFAMAKEELVLDYLKKDK